MEFFIFLSQSPFKFSYRSPRLEWPPSLILVSQSRRSSPYGAVRQQQQQHHNARRTGERETSPKSFPEKKIPLRATYSNIISTQSSHHLALCNIPGGNKLSDFICQDFCLIRPAAATRLLQEVMRVPYGTFFLKITLDENSIIIYNLEFVY